MPTYDYECPHCGNNFELFQRITDKPLENCPKCNKKVKRLIGSGSGIIFSRHNSFYASGRDPAKKLIYEAGKGSGFYATDYRKKSKDQKEKSDTCPKAKEGCRGCQP
jgi:putative FmdB family regulatory protein